MPLEQDLVDKAGKSNNPLFAEVCAKARQENLKQAWEGLKVELSHSIFCAFNKGIQARFANGFNDSVVIDSFESTAHWYRLDRFHGGYMYYLNEEGFHTHWDGRYLTVTLPRGKV
jgi:hypothetical protein